MIAESQEFRETIRLVEQAQTGCRQSFGALVERFEPAVRAALRNWQRDTHESAELVQDVFIHAMVKIGQLREPACFGAWLQRIAVRVAINRATRKPPFPTVESEVLERRAGPDSSPIDELAQREQRQIVRRAVSRLKPIDRDALMAFYLKGKSLAEIATEFDVPLGTVKRRLHVARHRLLELLRGKLGADFGERCAPVDPTAGVVRAPAARALRRNAPRAVALVR